MDRDVDRGNGQAETKSGDDVKMAKASEVAHGAAASTLSSSC